MKTIKNVLHGINVVLCCIACYYLSTAGIYLVELFDEPVVLCCIAFVMLGMLYSFSVLGIIISESE